MVHADRFVLQLLDVGATVTRDYADLKEIALFLAQPNVLPPGQALGLYISVSGEWQVCHIPQLQAHQVAFNRITELLCATICYVHTLSTMQWRGFVSNEHPSEVMPLQWPEITGGSLTGTNHPAVQLGVSLEPLGNSDPL